MQNSTVIQDIWVAKPWTWHGPCVTCIDGIQMEWKMEYKCRLMHIALCKNLQYELHAEMMVRRRRKPRAEVLADWGSAQLRI